MGISTAGTMRINIDHLGRVGIGTSSPMAKLHVSGGAILLDNSQPLYFKDAGGTVRPGLQIFSDDITYLDGAANGLQIRSNNSTVSALKIDSLGKVGIGTTSPQARLDIVGTGTAASSILIPRDTTANRPPGIEGMIRYNSTLAAFEGFQGTNWVHFSSSVSTNTDAMTAVSADFSNSITIDATGTSGACGTLTLAGMTNGGTYTLTMPNATSTCTTINVPGGMTLKTPVGYTAGQSVTGGVVYTFIRSGNNIWMSSVLF